jgi:hypothetical protein
VRVCVFFFFFGKICGLLSLMRMLYWLGIVARFYLANQLLSKKYHRYGLMQLDHCIIGYRWGLWLFREKY